MLHVQSNTESHSHFVCELIIMCSGMAWYMFQMIHCIFLTKILHFCFASFKSLGGDAIVKFTVYHCIVFYHCIVHSDNIVRF